MNPILSKLLPDVYKDFPHQDFTEHVDGWDGTNALFGNLVNKICPKVIVEVGTWMGQSAFTMAEACRLLQLDTAVICVDTWLGSIEHWVTWPHELLLVNGYPSLYRQFLANVIKRGLQDYIVPLPNTSLTGAAMLQHCGVRPDMIYIDANHDTDAVRLDMEHYYPLLAQGGLLFGHDLQEQGIVDAVNGFCAAHNVGWSRHEAFWMIDR